MADELNTQTVDTQSSFVSPDTDDLDAFNDLFHGRAKAAPEAGGDSQSDVKDETNQEVNEPDSSDDTKPEDTPTHTDGPDEEDSPDGDEDKPDEDGKPAKKTNRFQERINELTAKAREAERREKEVLRRLDELAAKQSNPTSTAETQPTPSVEKNTGPTPDDTNDDGSEKYPLGEFDPNYIRDLTRHTIQTEQAAANERQVQEQTERQATEAREQLQTQWVEKLSTATATHDDFMEKTIELESTFDDLDPQYSDYLVQTIKSLDHGPDVLYHFANNLDEAKQFVKLGPLAATLALGEMNARFKKSEQKQEDTKPQPKVSKAPPPPQDLVKGSKTRTSVAADTDDLDAFSKAFFKPRGRR